MGRRRGFPPCPRLLPAGELIVTVAGAWPSSWRLLSSYPLAPPPPGDARSAQEAVSTPTPEPTATTEEALPTTIPTDTTPPQAQAYPTSFEGDPEGPALPDTGQPSVLSAAAVTLYEQMDFPDTTPPTGICAQNFEPSLDQFDLEAADDFVIGSPDRRWQIQTVEVSGFYRGVGDRPAESVNVRFYEDSGRLPGALVREELNLAPEVGLESGAFVIDLPSPVSLGVGHYWLSVQANLDFLPDNRQWCWQKRDVQSGEQSALRNPGDGFLTGCTVWRHRMDDCGSQPGPDYLFRLGGAREEVGPPLATRSFYVDTKSAPVLFNAGRVEGRRGAGGLVILAFGKPVLVQGDQGAYGFAERGPFSPLDVKLLTAAFIDGWIQGFYIEGGEDRAPDAKLLVAIGTSNCGTDPDFRPANPRKSCVPGSRNVSANHGFGWGNLVDNIRRSLDLRMVTRTVTVVAASDMQLAWNYPSVTNNWIDGYMAYFDAIEVGHVALLDFGSCEGCAYANEDGSACTVPGCLEAPQSLRVVGRDSEVSALEWSWPLGEVLYKAWTSGVSAPIPEIYAKSSANARQWYGLSLYSAHTGTRPIFFQGVLTQCASERLPCAALPDGNAPETGWWQLFQWLRKDPLTAQDDIPRLTWIDYALGLPCFDC